MSPELHALGIDALSFEARTSLANAIQDDVESGAPLLTDELKALLDHFIADHDAHPEDVVPWEQVQAEVRARFKLP